MKELVTLVAIVLAVVGNLPYLLDVLKGNTKPHPYTWFVGSIVSATVFFGMFIKGAGIAAIPVAASEIFTLIIFFLSFKYGFKGSTYADKLFLVIALLGLIPWAITRDPTLSIIIAVTIDVLSFVPALRKTWLEPRTEHPILYASNVLRHGLILASLGAYNVATMLHSIAMIGMNSAMFLVITLRRSR